MADLARANSAWMGRVHSLLRDGFGYDDIALKMGCDASLIRDEGRILREEGSLDALVLAGKAEWTRKRTRLSA